MLLTTRAQSSKSGWGSGADKTVAARICRRYDADSETIRRPIAPRDGNTELRHCERPVHRGVFYAPSPRSAEARAASFHC